MNLWSNIRWGTSDGKSMKIEDMTDTHVHNSIQMLIKQHGEATILKAIAVGLTIKKDVDKPELKISTVNFEHLAALMSLNGEQAKAAIEEELDAELDEQYGFYGLWNGDIGI